MKEKLSTMEQQYQSALNQALAKFKGTKNELQEKFHAQNELKNVIRELVTKNKQI